MTDALLDLQRRIQMLAMDHRRSTGLELNMAHLQLRIHPEDWDHVVHSQSMAYAARVNPKDILGIQVVSDPTVALGHPVLRSTWEIVL